MNAEKMQVDGTHYTSMAIQPMRFSETLGLSAAEHTIVKYVSRYKNKNGLRDLEKAKHTVELLRTYDEELDVDTRQRRLENRGNMDREAMAEYIRLNKLSQAQADCVVNVCIYHTTLNRKYLFAAIDNIHALIAEEEERRMDVIGQNGNDGAAYGVQV